MSPLFDYPKFDPALKALLRETFPEFCSSSQNTDASSTIKSANTAGGNTMNSTAASQDTNSNDTANDRNSITIPPFIGPNHSNLDETSPLKKPTYSNSQSPNKSTLRVPPSESCLGVESESSTPSIDTGTDNPNPKRPLPATKKCDSDSEIRPKQEQPPNKKHKSKHPPESANDTNNSVLNVTSDANSKRPDSVPTEETIDTASACSNNNTNAKDHTPKPPQNQVTNTKKTKVIYPFMSISSQLDFEPARVISQFEKPVRQLFESLLKER